MSAAFITPMQGMPVGSFTTPAQAAPPFTSPPQYQSRQQLVVPQTQQQLQSQMVPLQQHAGMAPPPYATANASSLPQPLYPSGGSVPLTHLQPQPQLTTGQPHQLYAGGPYPGQALLPQHPHGLGGTPPLAPQGGYSAAPSPYYQAAAYLQQPQYAQQQTQLAQYPPQQQQHQQQHQHQQPSPAYQQPGSQQFISTPPFPTMLNALPYIQEVSLPTTTASQSVPPYSTAPAAAPQQQQQPSYDHRPQSTSASNPFFPSLGDTSATVPPQHLASFTQGPNFTINGQPQLANAGVMYSATPQQQAPYQMPYSMPVPPSTYAPQPLPPSYAAVGASTQQKAVNHYGGHTATSAAAAATGPISTVPAGPTPNPNPNPEPEQWRNLIVNYVPSAVDDKHLFSLFAMFGPIESVKIVTSKDTRQARGFGFVKFHTIANATTAMKAMNGFPIMNKRLKVSYASGDPDSDEESGFRPFVRPPTKGGVPTPSAANPPVAPNGRPVSSAVSNASQNAPQHTYNDSTTSYHNDSGRQSPVPSPHVGSIHNGGTNNAHTPIGALAPSATPQ